MKINEELLEQVEKLLMTKYSNEYGISDQEDIESMIDELLAEIRRKDEEIQDIKEDMKENYIYRWQ